MGYEFYNPNPCGKLVGDCVIRAISKALDQDWETTYMDMAMQGFKMCDMPSSNAVWGAYLSDRGFIKKLIQGDVSIDDFCEANTHGTYVLATGTHVVAVIDGTYYDAGDSGSEIPIYYWKKDGE